MKAVRLRITGHVQGVWYRDSAVREAQRLGLAGWIRNRDDGSVEAWAQGPHSEVDAFVAWCHHGPERADVMEVATTDVPATTLTDFERRPTA